MKDGGTDTIRRNAEINESVMASVNGENRRSPALERLEMEVARYGSAIVAFSGGVDSAVLLAVAHRLLGDRVLAVTADSESLPRLELERASAFAASIGAGHRVLQTSELQNADYARNDRMRCYHCKKTLFAECQALANELRVEALMYGFNRDDAGDFRPGRLAANEVGVVAPLFDAGLGKEEIRGIARELGLAVSEKPAAPCLSSRIPYGSAVTRQKLLVIEKMEDALHANGFDVVRARYDGTAMRIEVPFERIESLESSWATVERLAAELSVASVEIDREGFISGKLNRQTT